MFLLCLKNYKFQFWKFLKFLEVSLKWLQIDQSFLLVWIVIMNMTDIIYITYFYYNLKIVYKIEKKYKKIEERRQTSILKSFNLKKKVNKIYDTI